MYTVLGDAEFGPRLRLRRTAAGLSLAQLAERVHYSKGHLSRVERGLSSPSPDLERLCAEVLGFEVGAETSARPPEPVVRHRSTPIYALPEPGQHFVGRTAELAQLEALLTTSAPRRRARTVLCAITGMAGVGKTALAVQSAHRIRSRFPDGCLYIDLHGYSQNVPMVTVTDALDRMLRMLGMPSETIPHHPEDRAAVYRGAIAGRRTLVILDNAVDSRQVGLLLPHDPGCPVLVTSRSALPALDEAYHLPLGPLSSSEAVTLFSRVAEIDNGVARNEERPSAVSDVVDLCGRLPLAVRIAATRCRPGGARTVGDFARRLADQSWGLSELDDGERSVIAPFTVSFDALGTAEQQMFALLGLLPGEDCDAVAAAVLAGWDLPMADRALNSLADAHLLARTRPGRFHLHDLLRAFARQITHRTLTADARAEALGHLAGYYITAADVVGRVLAPHRYRLKVAGDTPAPAPPVVADHEEAVSWFTTEQRNITALVHETYRLDMHVACWQLAYVLRDFFFLTKRWDVWIASHRKALRAARIAADPDAEAVTANNLGLALVETGDLEGAAEHYRRAHQLFQETGDGHGAANAVANHAWVHYYRGEFTAALNEFNAALDYYSSSGARRNAAITLRGIGLAEVEMSRFDAAIGHLQSALATLESLDLRLDTAMALNCLGEAFVRGGRAAEATVHLERAVAVSRSCGSRHEEARALHNLGLAAHTDTVAEPQ
ncbi:MULTISPECIES: ATP-binding protein [unclassified Streptomyces]|uniref:ATP-binding protein n=1 Tax=unclassified Streptomyces TaxID=2593676 RepID=UPI00403C35D7